MFAGIYLSAYLAGRILAVLMSAPNLVSLWGGFIGTALFTIAIAYLARAPWSWAQYLGAAVR
ncbi:MAG: hypothetical protein IPL62_10155 [Caulobacteraceae bacterium]|nr:hypothetical protein [Caulobacteraceae bacterium]